MTGNNQEERMEMDCNMDKLENGGRNINHI